MAIDSAEVDLEWDANRRVLMAPFKILSGANRITLLARVEPPNGVDTDWRLGLSGGTIVLAANDSDQPLILNRLSVGVRIDTEKRRVVLSQALSAMATSASPVAAASTIPARRDCSSVWPERRCRWISSS